MNPQQNHFSYDSITLDSQFDSGNLYQVEKISNQKVIYLQQFNLWIAPDCCQTVYEKKYKSWFFFRAQNFSLNEKYTFTIKNIQGQFKQFQAGLCPVFRIQSEHKYSLHKDISFQKNENNTELSIHFTFVREEPHFFAFTFPFTYQDNIEKLDLLEQQFKNHDNIYLQRFQIAESIEKRRIDLIIITLRKNIEKKSIQTYSDFKSKKPIVFFSARVHPGEIPANHLLEGILDYILKKNTNILEHFVFLIVPMLNPDGVFRGHWRVDTLGQNLNRFYQNPDPQKQPSIYALDKVVNYFHTYMHAHAGKQGCFIFGNQLEFRQQVDIILFNKLIALNAQDFDFSGCNFTEKNMYQADKSDGLSKEGSSRVSFYKKYNIKHCYTIECNYTKSAVINNLNEKTKTRKMQALNNKEFQTWYFGFISKQKQKSEFLTISSEIYTEKTFQNLGHGICYAIEDLCEKNESSRIYTSPFLRLDYLKYYLAIQLAASAPYRFDQPLRPLLKGLHEKKEMFLGAFNQLKSLLEK